MKKISVIIPCYNASSTIVSCVQCVIDTGYPSLQIVLVDDVSTDNTAPMLEELRDRYPRTITVVRHEINSGPAKGRNTGAAHADGDYLFFLDSDTEMLPDALDNFIATIERCDAVTGIYHYESLNPGWASTYKALLNYYFFSRKGVIDYEVFDASRAGIKTAVFRDLGGFNESLKWGMDYENEEFGYRLTRKYKNLLDPSIVVKHVFPGIAGLTKTYFLRVALWMEVFMTRKKFESGGVTSAGTGLSSAALLACLVLLPLMFLSPSIGYLCTAFFFIYLWGYFGFWCFVLKQKPSFIVTAALLNMYFTLVIAAGALFGFLTHIIHKFYPRTGRT
jgi:glycosyltransferase involved in cell wall biosynthesis